MRSITLGFSSLAPAMMLALLVMAGRPATASECPLPGSGGCSSGPAVVAQSVGPSEFAGNPVHLATGNKYQREADIESVEDGFPLELVRHYNSRVAYRGLFGYGWRMSYEAVARVGTSGVQIVQADGRRLQFDRDPHAPARCTAQRLEDGTVEETSRGVVWHWPDGQRLVFAASGRLDRIEASDGAITSLDYDPAGNLLQVTSNTGARLSFDLVPDASARGRLVSAVHAPAGVWRYRYDARDRLVEVVPPGEADAVVRQYRYENDRSGGDPTNLTGIVLRRGREEQRVASYRYDARDRVIESDSAIAGETLRFEYDDQPHQTRVIDGMGRTSRYRFASIGGLERLVESRGPGCTTCPPTQVRWTWDGNAQLVLEQRIDDDGRPVSARRLRRDAQQRVVEVDALRYSDGRVVSDRWVERRRYADATSTRPVRISEPSVVVGREHAVELEWTTNLRLASITEVGWIPDGAALADLARATEGSPERATLGIASGVEVRRRLRIIESTVAGLSRVSSIDGPAEHEVRERRWDREGRLLAAIDPGGVSRDILGRDAMGRAVRWRTAEGVETNLSFDLEGRAIDTRVAGVGVHLSRDLLGRVVAIEPDRGDVYRLERNRLEQVIAVHDSSGAILRVTRDGDGNPEQLDVRDNSGRVVYGPMRFGRDPTGRLASIGEESHSFDYAFGIGHDGMLANVTDAVGRNFRVTRGSADRVSIERRGADSSVVMTSRWLADPTHRVLLHRDAAGRAALRVDDDFGRTVLEVHPDSGAILSRHDIHDALVARMTSDGYSLAITRDAAGRPLAAGQVGGPDRVLWEWNGSRLMSVVDPAERRFYQYDGAGRMTLERRELLSSQRWVKFERNFAYDGAGRLARVGLPDGHRLEHVYDARGLLTSIRFDGAPVVEGIEWRPFGLGIDGGLSRMAHPGGSESVFDYDHHGQAIGFDEPAYRASIERDALGRILGVNAAGLADRYRYDDAGRLVEARSTDGVQQWRYSAAGRRLDGDPQAAKLLRVSTSAAPDMRVHVALERGTVVSAWSPTDLVHYAYAHSGERFERWTPAGATLFLQDGTRTLAEADTSGHVQRHYVWIGQRPVAVVDLELQGIAQVSAVTADFRDAPIRLTDAQGHVQWSARYDAFGAAQVSGSRQLNLRLPGQTYDAVSGLHHHLHRDYDPALGRFIQADPIGWQGGPNGYAYVANDPVNRTDPSGLYESDVHYYLTYFLAIVSGVSASDARTIALASQYVDDNPLTAPVVLDQDGNLELGETFETRATALKDYHFVLSDSATGKVPSALYTKNYANPQSPQLSRLYSAVTTSESDSSIACAAHLQLFGEYLHAFADTFSHRTGGNLPYDATFPFTDNKALGHGSDGKNPDLTFNHWGLDTEVFEGNPPIALTPASTYWASNEARTVEMAKEVAVRMSPFASANAKPISWVVLQPIITQFVKVKGDEDDGKALMPAKIAVLNLALKALGFSESLVWADSKTGQSSYDLAEAAANRAKLLAGLDASKYPGTLLP